MNVKVAYEDESGKHETIVPIEKMNEIPGTILQVHLGTGEHCERTGVEIFEGDWIWNIGFNVDYLVKFGKYRRERHMNGDLPHEHICFYLEQYEWMTYNQPEKKLQDKRPFLEEPDFYGNKAGYCLISPRESDGE